MKRNAQRENGKEHTKREWKGMHKERMERNAQRENGKEHKENGKERKKRASSMHP